MPRCIVGRWERQTVFESEAAEATTQTKDVPKAEVKEFDIKDLNVIDDKMARGTAKKAFLAAKRTGEDKVEAIRKALSESGKLDTAIEELLDSLSGDGIEVTKLIDTEKPADPSEDASTEPSPKSEPAGDLPLFEITELNGIDDRVARGTAKKVYLAGNRNGKFRAEVLKDIGAALEEIGKMNDLVISILRDLEKK